MPPIKSSADVEPVQGRSYRLAIIQLGSIGDDKGKNLQHAREKVAEASRGGSEGRRPDVIVLPEVFNSPYGAQHFPKYAETIGWDKDKDKSWSPQSSGSDSVKMLSQAAKDAGAWLFGGSIPERSSGEDSILYNSATVFSPAGELIALHRKLHLFDIDIPGGITFKESETLTGGNEAVTVIETDFGKIGLGICYDMRFPEMAMIAARRGCTTMIYPGAFNLTTGPLHWELLQRARAVDNQIYVASCSPARDMSAGYHAWGHSTIVDPMAKVIATTDEKESIIFADIDVEEINKARRGIPLTVQRRFDTYKDVSA